MRDPTIHTIGHSNHTLEAFVALLHGSSITCLVDVRSHPYSRWVPHFGKRTLAGGLRAAGVEYRFMGETLGGRPAGDQYYHADGRVNHARRRAAPDFLAAVNELTTLAGEARVAMMCAEEDPARCHRRALIAPALLERGVAVVHVRGDGRTQAESPEQVAEGQLRLLP